MSQNSRKKNDKKMCDTITLRTRLLTSGMSLVWTQSIGLPTYCLVVTSRENPSRQITGHRNMFKIDKHYRR
jgi:hypothetical protein